MCLLSSISRSSRWYCVYSSQSIEAQHYILHRRGPIPPIWNNTYQGDSYWEHALARGMRPAKRNWQQTNLRGVEGSAWSWVEWSSQVHGQDSAPVHPGHLGQPKTAHGRDRTHDLMTTISWQKTLAELGESTDQSDSWYFWQSKHYKLFAAWLIDAFNVSMAWLCVRAIDASMRTF